MIVRRWEGVWDPSRARDILRDAGVFDRLEDQTARNLLVKALAKFRDVIREAERYLIPFLFLAWTLVWPIEAPALVTSFIFVVALNAGGGAKSTSIGATVCSAELIVSI
jgi:nitrate reductase NapE component